MSGAWCSPAPSWTRSGSTGRAEMAARRWLTIVWSTIVSLVLSDTSSLAQGVKPLAQWRFDESQGPAAQDDAGGADDNIAGLYKFVRGVAGNALQFDGYTTSIQRPWQRVPPITGGFTVEAWVALVFFSSRRRHTRSDRDWSSDVCSSD